MRNFVWIFLAGANAFAMGYAGDQSADSPAFWARHTIDESDQASGKLGADGVRLADANGDGHLDVVTGWENGDAIRVCLNPGPGKAKQPWKGMTVGRVAGAEDAVFADLDGDGLLDVVSSTEGKTKSVFVHWAPGDQDEYPDGSQWSTESVPALMKRQRWMYGLPFDVNADGRMDLILGSKDEGATVGWLEQPGENPRQLSDWRYHPLYEAGWIMSIRSADLDRDGDEDVIFSDRKGNSSGVWWLENIGEDKGQPFGDPVRLGLAGEEVMFVDIADVNRDGRLDVVAAVREYAIGILIQPPAVGAPWQERTVSFSSQGGRFGTGTAKAVRWFPSEDPDSMRFLLTCERAKGDLHGVLMITAPLELSERTVESSAVESVSGPLGEKFDRMELLDLDGDGDLDLMTCEERNNLGVFWYENPGN